jgi:hypothetical protein
VGGDVVDFCVHVAIDVDVNVNVLYCVHAPIYCDLWEDT